MAANLSVWLTLLPRSAQLEPHCSLKMFFFAGEALFLLFSHLQKKLYRLSCLVEIKDWSVNFPAARWADSSAGSRTHAHWL